jgi:hypothetical protein
MYGLALPLAGTSASEGTSWSCSSSAPRYRTRPTYTPPFAQAWHNQPPVPPAPDEPEPPTRPPSPSPSPNPQEDEEEETTLREELKSIDQALRKVKKHPAQKTVVKQPQEARDAVAMGELNLARELGGRC